MAMGSGIPIQNPNGRFVGFRGASQDISNQKEIENRLRRTVEKLERSNVELARFAEVAAHDLQEPLRIMVSYAHLLSRRYKGQLNADADDFIGFIVDSSVRMKSLIQDLLRYSLIDRSDPPLALADTSACIGEAVDDLARSHPRLRRTNRLADQGAAACGQFRQVTEIFRNLLSNAIEYRSADRNPIIRIDVRPVGSAWEFTVSDNGIGIEAKYFDRIFLVFERLHTQRAIPAPGLAWP